MKLKEGDKLTVKKVKCHCEQLYKECNCHCDDCNYVKTVNRASEDQLQHTKKQLLEGLEEVSDNIC